MTGHLEYPTLLINHLIDEGAKEEIDLIVKKCEDETVIDYLADKYKVPGLSDFARKQETEERLKDFVRAYTKDDFRRKYLVENNGLNLIIAALIFS